MFSKKTKTNPNFSKLDNILIDLTNPTTGKVFDELIHFISKMYKADMVHADLSAFNILMHRNKPYLIDIGQGVLLEHPNAQEFLKRDILNIVTYFRKYSIIADENYIFEKIVRG
jgi:RIO kinase 1